MSSEPGATALAPEAEAPWKTLSPRAPLAALFPVLGLVLRPMLGALLPTFFMRDGGFPAFIWAIILLFAGSSVAALLYEVATTRYRVVGAQLEIRSGVFTKTSRFIEAARVQNTEVVQPFVSKLLGLVELKVETASGQKAEGHLRGLTPGDAQALIDALHMARGNKAQALAPVGTPGEADGEVLANTRLVDLLRYGATATGLGVLAVVMGALNELMELFHDWALPWMQAHWKGLARPGMGWVSAVLVVLAGLLVLWLVNVVLAVLRFHGFRLVDTGTHFRALGGLFTSRQITVRHERIQQVVLDEPLLRRWFGFGSVEVETAGVRAGREAAERAELVVPVVPTSRMEALVDRLIPGLPAALGTLSLRPAHPKSLLRARIRAVGVSVLVATPATFLLWPWGVLAWALLPLQLVGAWFDWRFQGWLITDTLVVVRQGFWRRRTTVLQRARIQAVNAVQGPLERGYGIGHVRVAVAGSDVVLPSVSWDEAGRLIDALPAPRRTRQPPPGVRNPPGPSEGGAPSAADAEPAAASEPSLGLYSRLPE
ncbi:PH domain-containing protein [Pyxidicoccus fallax]|uniref:PH domain-containing protein n=1 Tax=Pyxidicoccus fallax TaxID=394095 RepID=A0A848M1W8_9BACT|nr:PH domain-containing protein [Pyxidicoccus fallax]NMO23344.1 PH domain-containing protein [Pyxidicoccus fallax]NPC86417.1 PH domain-containing protein [Pyxidicoccus fallax]